MALISGATMNVVVDELPPKLRCLRLDGRLDMKGAGEIELRFTSLAATDGNAVLVDMNGVDFVASIGMRLLLSCAKAKAARGGRMILFGLQPLMQEALETAGIDSLMAICPDQAAALAVLNG
jgi:anti-sigma B factor antagonist